MGQLVVHGNLKLNTVVPSGTGDNVLTADPSTGDLGQIGAIDTSTYIPKALTSAYILVGNGSNVATGVAVTGDITMSNAGVAGIASGVIVNDDVNASAAIALSKLAATTASRALVSDGSGFVSASAVTSTELGYVSGVTSAIQTQLNAKVATATLTTNGDILYRDGTGTVTRLPVGTNGYVLGVTAGIPTWEAKQPVPNGGTTDQYLAKNSNTDGDVAWVTLTAAKITDVTATAAELNITDGLTATTTELNYSSGVTSAIQTQIDSKQATITGAATTVVSSNLTASRAVISNGSGKLAVSTVTDTELAHLSGVTSPIQGQIDAKQNATLTQNAIWVGNAFNVPTALAAGTAGQVLTISAGAPTWVTPGSGGTVTSVQVSGGTTGMSFSGGPITTTGTMTMTGTLAVANGGTNITSYAVGDLIQATGATTLSALASVSAGSYLRSGGVTTASAWSTVKLPDTMSALGLWVANSANTTVNLTAAAGQSVRVNAVGTAWEAYTPAAGGTWGSITGTLSDQTDLQTALDLKLNKAGDTYTTTSGDGLALTTSTLTSGDLVQLSSTGTAAASNTQTVLKVETSGANATSTQTTYGGYFSNTHTGTNSTNVGLFATASGGTTNYAIQTSGAVNFAGNITSNGTLHTFNGTNPQLVFSGTSSQVRVQSLIGASTSVPLTIGASIDAAGTKSQVTTSSGAAITQTSGTPNLFNVNASFSPTSGTAAYTNTILSGTINQTGTAVGDVKTLRLAHTYTAATADVYDLDINPTVTSISGNITGVYYNPNITALGGTNNAFHATSGDIKLNSGNIILGDASTAGALKTISVAGSASNISLDLVPKGSSGVIVGSRYFQLGRTSDGDTFRTITSEGSATDITLDIYSKGALGWIDVNGHFQVYDLNNAAGDRAQFGVLNYAGLQFNERNSYFEIKSLSAAGATADLKILAGVDTPGGADLYLDVETGGTTDGNIGLLTSTVSNWQSMERGFYEGNVDTAPTGDPTSGLFRWVSSEPEGSNMKIRTTGGHFAKPVLQAKVTIAGGATLQSIGSVPQTIIAAPGASKYINVISVSVSYNYGTVAYDFSGTEIPTFKFSGGTVGYRIGTSLINGAVDFHRTLQVANVATDSGMDVLANTAFVLTTDDAGDATTGDGDLDVVVYYTIETTNT